MHYEYTSSSCGHKPACSSFKDFPNSKMDRCKISKWEAVPKVFQT